MRILKTFMHYDKIPNDASLIENNYRSVMKNNKVEISGYGLYLVNYVDETKVLKNQEKTDNHNQTIFNVIQHLNKKTGSRFKANTSANRKLLMARINEGFTEDDFITVINNQCSAWLDSEFSKYLRPSTLFRASKIEGYLSSSNEAVNPFDELDDILSGDSE